jgi:heme-degrading monooxygenase HmoA
VIVCLRTVTVPPEERRRFLGWIAQNRDLRQRHGILLEWVLQSEGGDETVVATAWPSDEVFDAWIRTPDRDRLTASEVHQSVDYRPLTRYRLVGGYTNVSALRAEEEER